MAELHPTSARELWKALMDNATALVDDAHTLLANGSHGRARSLTVLAQEELGKAIWLYEEFQTAWNDGDPTSREVEKLEKHGRSHIQKYLTAGMYGHRLAAFWGDYGGHEDIGDTPEEWDAHFEKLKAGAAAAAVEAEEAARSANIAKQHGFYVDINGDTGVILSPSAVEAGTIAEDLRRAAQVVEMQLISDHSRMKYDASTPYDSTHDQQSRLLPISHPEVWAAATDAIVADGPPSD